MQFKYEPEGADPRVWDFAPAKMMSPEAEAIERFTKMTFVQWQQAMQDGSMLATRAYLWVMLKREIPTLKADDVEFSMSDIDWVFDDEERAEIRSALQAKVDAGEELGADERALLDEVSDTEPEAEATGPKAVPAA